MGARARAVAGIQTVGVVLCWQLVCGCEGCRDAEEKSVDWEIQSLYQRANIALTDRKYRVAEREYRKVIERNPNHAEAHVKLAMALEGRAEQEVDRRQELLQQAIGLLEKAVGLEPKSMVGWHQLARMARKAGRKEQTMTALRKMRQLHPADRKSLLAIVEMQEQDGDLQAAEQTLKSALADDVGPVHLAYGQFLLRQRRVDEGRAMLKTIQACPKVDDQQLGRHSPCPTAEYYMAQNELGGLAVRQGRLEDARKIFTAMVQMFPDDYLAFEVLAAIDEREGKWQEAEKKYRQSLAVDRLHASVWRGLGRCQAARGLVDEALFAYRKADQFLSKNPSQALQMADELVSLGQRAWAEETLERAKILASDDAALTQALGDKLNQLAKRSREEKPDGGATGADRP